MRRASRDPCNEVLIRKYYDKEDSISELGIKKEGVTNTVVKRVEHFHALFLLFIHYYTHNMAPERMVQTSFSYNMLNYRIHYILHNTIDHSEPFNMLDNNLIVTNDNTNMSS